MATAAELVVKIGSDIRGLEKGISKASRKVQDVGKTMQRVGSRMTAAITLPMAALGGKALKTAADFEKLQIQMNTLAGSAEEGAAAFERLQEFSAGTPFQMQDLVRANNILVGMGQSMDNAFESMQMLGDVSAATGANIQELAVTFGQASAEGKLMTRDIREFINRGVPMTKLLADSMGVAKSEIFDLAEQGKISFEVLQQALRDATTEGGIYEGATEDLADTLSGRFSTLRDNIDRSMAQIGDAIADAFDLKSVMETLTSVIQEITERFEGLSADSRREIIKIAGLLSVGGPLLVALGVAAQAVAAFASFVNKRFLLITASVVAVTGTIEQQTQLWTKFFTGSEKEVDNFTTSSRKMLGRMIKPLVDVTEKALGLGKGVDGLISIFNGLGKETDKANEVLERTNSLLGFISGRDYSSILSFDVQADSEIEQPDQDISNPFEGMANPIEEASVASRQLDSDIGEVNNTISGVPKNLSYMASNLGITGEALKGTGDAWDRFKSSFTEAGKQAKLTSDAVTMAFQSMADESIDSLSDLAKVTINTARKIISAEIAKGVAAAVRGALTNVPFPLNIAAAAGAGAAASGLFNSIVPQLAQGGLAFGPTMAVVGDNVGARSNPEVIAPLDKLQGMMSGGTQKVIVEGQLKGKDIYLSNQRGGNNFNR
jgi:tape measure domain-containing protein